MPTGVVTGPFSATLWVLMAASVSGGSTSAWPRSTAVAPASTSIHSTSRPALSSTRRVARVTSGPIPSPGMRTMVCFAMCPTA